MSRVQVNICGEVHDSKSSARNIPESERSEVSWDAMDSALAVILLGAAFGGIGGGAIVF